MKWSNKEEALLIKYYLLGYNYYDIAYKLNRSYDSVTKKARVLGLVRDKKEAKNRFIERLHEKGYSDEEVAELFEVNVSDLESDRFINYRVAFGEDTNIWDLFTSIQKKIFKHRNIIDDYYIDIESKCPIISVIPLADLHIGSLYTDYDSMKSDIEYISNMPCTYVILLGDLIDNMIWKKSDSDELTGVKMQLLLLEEIFTKLQDKIIAIITGDHEKFTEVASELDIYRDYFHKFSIDWGTRLIIHINNNQYRILARHRYRYNSSQNLTNTVKRMMEKVNDADIGIVAHTHIPAYEMFYLRGRPRYAIRVGSYKRGDNFLEKNSILEGTPIFPTILLGTNKYYMNVVSSPQEANFYISNSNNFFIEDGE